MKKHFDQKETITTSNGDVIKISRKDHRWLSAHTWWLTGKGYPSARIEGRVFLMHRLILSCPDDGQVDHINGDILDNRRENLRLATQAENMHNRRKNTRSTSQYKGVSRHRQTQKWLVHIKVDGKVRHVGLFADEELAAHAYDQAAREHYGAYACTNFPVGEERRAA